eukprot:SAG31_NODE_4799_length_2952_cov_2.405889_1_plen_337_part_00
MRTVIVLLISAPIHIASQEIEVQRLWPYPAGAWGPYSAPPCTTQSAADLHHRCGNSCTEREPFHCEQNDQVIPWWKQCDGVNDCQPSSNDPQHAIAGSRCALHMNASQPVVDAWCSADERGCDGILGRILDGKLAGIDYDWTSGVLQRTRVQAGQVARGTRLNLALFDTLENRVAWNYFRTSLERRYSGGVSCDQYYSDSETGVLYEEPGLISVSSLQAHGSIVFELGDSERGVVAVFRPELDQPLGEVDFDITVRTCSAVYETSPCSVHDVMVTITVVADVVNGLDDRSALIDRPGRPRTSAAAAVVPGFSFWSDRTLLISMWSWCPFLVIMKWN